MALKHWIWLSMRNVRRDKLWQLCTRFDGAQAVYEASDSELTGEAELTKDEIISLRSDRNFVSAEKVVAECEKKHICIIPITDEVYPMMLRNIDSPPIILYARGNVNCLTENLPFGIVGTRKASPKSLELTHKMSYMLAKSGFTIVSGMAAGADSAAACGALDAGCKTIAVFGTGVDICYPKSNQKLMEAIMSNGCVISENAPGTPPLPWTFPQRNRIIAGISAGVLVTAAPEKSGSIITATLAMEQGKDVYVTPGSLDDKEYTGSLALIKDGASMITEVEDIIYAYGKTPAKADKSYERILQMRRYGTSKQPENIEKTQPEKIKAVKNIKKEREEDKSIDKITDGMSEEEKAIIKVILDGDTQFDMIAAKTGLDAGDLFAKLTMLEINGKVEQKPGKNYELIL